VSAASLERVCDVFERALSSECALPHEAKRMMGRRYLQCVSDYEPSIERIRELRERLSDENAHHISKRPRTGAAAGGPADAAAVAAGTAPPVAASPYSNYHAAAAANAYAYQQYAYQQYYAQAQTFHAQQAYAAASGYYQQQAATQQYATATTPGTS
jgi:hypothetical protein